MIATVSQYQKLTPRAASSWGDSCITTSCLGGLYVKNLTRSVRKFSLHKGSARDFSLTFENARSFLVEESIGDIVRWLKESYDSSSSDGYIEPPDRAYDNVIKILRVNYKHLELVHKKYIHTTPYGSLAINFFDPGNRNAGYVFLEVTSDSFGCFVMKNENASDIHEDLFDQSTPFVFGEVITRFRSTII